MEEDGLSRILRNHRWNALLAWLFVGLVLVTSLASLLTGNLLWAGFTAVVALLALIPAASTRSPWVMPPWEIVLIATFPTIAHLFALEIVPGDATDTVQYGSVAALALLIAVDLDAFTPVEMNDGFAALFVIVATMATAGIWSVVRWAADQLLGTAFIVSEHALMVEFVGSAAAGAIAGLIYVFYFRRRAEPDVRTPEEVDLP